jgi:hypothetical protein
MEAGRTRWTDERIDDLAISCREEMREFRAEMRDGFRQLREEMREMRADVRALYGETGLNRRWVVNLWATMILGFVGLLVETSLR